MNHTPCVRSLGGDQRKIPHVEPRSFTTSASSMCTNTDKNNFVAAAEETRTEQLRYICLSFIFGPNFKLESWFGEIVGN